MACEFSMSSAARMNEAIDNRKISKASRRPFARGDSMIEWPLPKIQKSLTFINMARKFVKIIALQKLNASI